MSEHAQDPHPGAPLFLRRAIYIGSALILVLIALWAIFAFTATADNERALRKAGQLSAQLKAAGLPVPSTDAIVDTFGDDGGMVCAEPDAALSQARYNMGLSNGAAHVGSRPVLADKDVAQAETLVIATYCPSELAEFTGHLKQLKFEDTAK
ncbi:hypothetical protein [Spirillospora sp. NPDC047279]|uniref:hypothetical protein n=1 Tax=Spirillospora sp. NPDC047279 TaxID=3155478 RepID=UPI0033DCC7E1